MLRSALNKAGVSYGMEGSLEIFFLKADWNPSVSHFELKHLDLAATSGQ